MTFRLFIFLLAVTYLSYIPLSVMGQENNISNLKYQYIRAFQDTTLYEDYTIVRSSVQCISDHCSELYFQHDNNSLHVRNSSSEACIIKYRTLGFNLIKGTAVLDSSNILMDERVMLLKSDNEGNSFSRRFIETSNIEYRGNFTRGISFGNTQDLVLNSNLNLQLSGDLGNGLYLTAAISDENIPLQPEGNTQVLQDFNKVFIELRKDNIALTAGDYEIGRPQSYFMNYFKKLQGVSFESSHRIDGNWAIDNRASFAVSRGKFRRVMLETREGNQGPYRLDGENGEVFLQILSGTERVFADGRLLTRGENEDYIIDYNRAEIRFTPKTIITANLRIIVEFEYAVQSYLRSLYATETMISNKRWQFNINAYSEQDSKSVTGNVTLDSTDLNILMNGGDDQNFKSGIIPVNELEGESLIAYKMSNGILEYAPGDTTDIFTARFSNFGNNMGAYAIDEQAGINGRVYRFVGEGNGAYLPLVRLVPPEQKQMFTASAQYNVSDSSTVFIETALTRLDQNRFSDIDNEDNNSVGIKSKFKDIRRLDSAERWFLSTELQFEYLANNFEALNPFRPQEFSRDWNLNNAEQTGSQILAGAAFKLSKDKNWLAYEFNSFTEQGSYNGIRHQPEIYILKKSWFVNLKGNWLESDFNGVESKFFRPRVNFRKDIVGDALQLGGYLEKEKNLITRSDSLSAESFNYDLYRVFLDSKATDNLSLRLAVSTRIDDRIVNDELSKVTEGRNIEFGGSWKGNASSDLRWQLVLRDYIVEDNFLDRDEPNKAFIGNIDHKLKILKGGLSLSTYYESNSGQEPKIEFQFVRVQTGEGSYIWNDYNQDSIRQINEFEIAPFSDLAAYEKISVFNNEFISTNRNILNQSIRIDLKRIIQNKNSVLNRLYFFSRYRIDQKNQTAEGSSFFNFISFDVNSQELVSFNSSFDHSIFINRGQPAWDMQISFRSIQNKLLQISGFDQRLNKRYYSRARYNLKRFLDAILEFEIGRKNRESENFSGQNFSIDSWSISPQLNYRPSSRFRIIANIIYENQANQEGLGEQAKKLEFGTEISWRNSSLSNLEFGLEFVNFDFTGERNSPVEFEMLQGLRKGQNVLWRLSYIKRVSNSIDLILNYNGRKSEDSRTVNTATVQMRAIF